MAELTPDLSNPKELIAAYRYAVSKRAYARRCTMIIIVGVVVLYIALMWDAVSKFRYEQLPEFATAVNLELAAVAPKVVEGMGGMLDRLYPVYLDAFQKRFERDYPEIQAEALKQLELLEEYAQKQWPEIQEGIVDLVLAQETVFREELTETLGPEEAERISVIYGEVLTEKYDEILSTTLKEQREVAQLIGENLNKLMEAEPDIAKPVKMQEVLGVTLELAGIELQKDL